MKITENTSQALRQWCRDNLPPIQPVAHYNPTFAELIQHREQGKVLVFNGGAATENTVFLKPDDRFYYRAWHDTIHIRQHLPLDHVSELKVARLLPSEPEPEPDPEPGPGPAGNATGIATGSPISNPLDATCPGSNGWPVTATSAAS